MIKEYDLFLTWENEAKNNVYELIKPEFFFRLNPHWAIPEFTIIDGEFSFEAIDHDTKDPVPMEGSYGRNVEGQLVVQAEDQVWQSIRFVAKKGSLWASVTYREEPSEEQEQHLVFWLRSIKEYLRIQSSGTLYAKMFKKAMDKIILPMTPSQRKICLMLLRLTALEVLVIIIIVVGYFFFMR